MFTVDTNNNTDMLEKMGIKKQTSFAFSNGYGASVLTYSFGHEVAVLDREGNITYDTPITDDVVFVHSDRSVMSLLAQIAAL